MQQNSLVNYKIKVLDVFEHQTKKLIKKYPSLKQEIAELVDSLKTNPEQGTQLGKGCYKIRVAVRSKGRGKSGGTSVITHVLIAETTVFLLNIYDKSEKETLSDAELSVLLKRIPF